MVKALSVLRKPEGKQVKDSRTVEVKRAVLVGLGGLQLLDQLLLVHITPKVKKY